jgi:peptidoglycan-associated lipoprotein
MKKFWPIILIVIIGLALGACGKKQVELPPEQPPAQEVDTTTPPPPPPPPPPPQEKPQVTAQDFKIVYFDFDKSNIRPDQRSRLDYDAKLLGDNPDMHVQIAGHCDERGTVEYNIALGERRARAVKKYLTELGIDGSRMEIISYGEERPADPRHNEEAWAKNRRAEFVILSD